MKSPVITLPPLSSTIPSRPKLPIASPETWLPAALIASPSATECGACVIEVNQHLGVVALASILALAPNWE